MNTNNYLSKPIQYFKSKKMTGFTLPELMITIAISGILLTVGVPSFTTIIRENRQTTLFNDLTSFLLYVKSQAITQKKLITLCPRDVNGTNCDNSANWDDGWIAFVDSSTTGTVDGDDSVLKIHEAIHSDMNITANSSTITINNRGLISGAITPIFTVCDGRGSGYERTKVLRKTAKLRSSDTHQVCR